MRLDDIILWVFLFCIIVVPVLGATARFALLPLIEALIRLRESTPAPGAGPSVERWMQQLEEDLAELRKEVKVLNESQAFLHELAPPPPSRLEQGTDGNELAPLRQ